MLVYPNRQRKQVESLSSASSNLATSTNHLYPNWQRERPQKPYSVSSSLTRWTKPA